MIRMINELNILDVVIDLQQFMEEVTLLNNVEKVYALLEVAASLIDVTEKEDRMFIEEALNETVFFKLDSVSQIGA